MITGALIGGCVFSAFLFFSNTGPTNEHAYARAFSMLVFFTCLGALTGSFF